MLLARFTGAHLLHPYLWLLFVSLLQAVCCGSGYSTDSRTTGEPSLSAQHSNTHQQLRCNAHTINVVSDKHLISIPRLQINHARSAQHY